LPKAAPSLATRISRSPRVTIALILEPDSDVSACVARLASQCERNGAYGVVVTAAAGAPDEGGFARRVRIVHAPADASRSELRHLAMHHADGDIVLLEDVASDAGPSVTGAFSARDLTERARSCPPASEWGDILRAHGVADAPPSRSLTRNVIRAAGWPVREALPVTADAHHRA
jgi:hypothetical protein